MKIGNQNNESTAFYFGNAADRGTQANDAVSEKKTSRRNRNQKNTTTISATALNMNQQDSITMKKVKAQKEAMKTLLNQFTSDKKVDDDLQSRSKRISELDSDIAASQEEVGKIDDLKKQVKESYGVTDDSEEQANLELLEKQRQSLKKGSHVKLTDEESQKLSSMGPKTEYQTAMLDYNAMEDVWNDKIKAASDEKTGQNETIKSIKKSLLEVHPMVDAQGQAKDILDKANKEVVGMLIKEAKDHIDEEQDKRDEKAEKAAEEAKEEEKKAEKKNIEKKNTEKNAAQKTAEASKTNDSTSTDNMSRVQKADGEQQQFQVELKNLVDNKKITVDDSKGIVVDEQR